MHQLFMLVMLAFVLLSNKSNAEEEPANFFSTAQIAQTTKSLTCDNQQGFGPKFFSNVSNLARYSSYLQIFAEMEIQCSGRLSKWTMVQNGAALGSRVYLDVWRPMSDNASYGLVASTRVVATSQTTSIQVIEIQRSEQGFVEKGDVIGIHYDMLTTPVSKRIIPYMELEDLDGPMTATHLWQLQHADLESSGYTVSLYESIAINQKRAPAIYANIETDPDEPKKPPPVGGIGIWPWTNNEPIVQLKLGNYSFTLRPNDTQSLWSFLLLGEANSTTPSHWTTLLLLILLNCLL